MNNYQQITQTTEALGTFLRSLPVVEGPWDAEFQARFCAGCPAENCDACPHGAARNNPGWWLALDAGAGEQPPQEGYTPVLWPDGVNSRMVLEHYGYKRDLDGPRGFWSNDGTIFERFCKIPEVIQQFGNGKIRVIFDYDPDFPRALVQILGLAQPDIKSIFGNGEEKPQEGTMIDLTDEEGGQCSQEEAERMKKMFRYAIESGIDDQTVRIVPMDGSGGITLFGAEDIQFFINYLLDCTRKA